MRPALDLQMPQQAEAAGERADQRALLLADARRGEALDDALLVEYAEGGVSRVRDEPRLVGDALEHLIAVELRRQRQAGGVHGLQLLALLLERIGQRAEPLGVQAVAELERAEIVKDRRREGEHPRDTNEQRYEMRGAGGEKPLQDEVLEAHESGDQQ